MKRFLALVLCAAMLVCATVGVSATVSYEESEPTDLGTLVVKKGASQEEVTEFNGSVVNLAPGGGSFCPKADCWVRYEFNAEKTGTYTFVIEYVARTGTLSTLLTPLTASPSTLISPLITAGRS